MKGSKWRSGETAVCSAQQLLGLLVKLVHYNSAYLGEDVLSHLISHTCSMATQPSSPSETEVWKTLIATLLYFLSPFFPLTTAVSVVPGCSHLLCSLPATDHSQLHHHSLPHPQYREVHSEISGGGCGFLWVWYLMMPDLIR